MKSGATFSPCRRYRYRLWREWDAALPTVAFCGLNPSTAAETVDDPTIRRCVGFAKAWGYGRFEMLNLFGWRSTDPDGLLGLEDPIGPGNDGALVEGCLNASRVVMAWGRFHKQRHLVGPRVFVVRRLLQERRSLQERNFQFGHLGLNGDGSPKHPLFLKGTTPFTPIEST